MDLPDDVVVAGVAAACTVAVAVLSAYVLPGRLPFLLRIAPLAGYFLFVFGRRTLPAGLDTVENWTALVVAISVAVLAYAVV